MSEFEGKNNDFEIVEESNVDPDDIRRIDTDELSIAAITLLECNELEVDIQKLKRIFYKVYEFYREMLVEPTFIDDFHEECEFEEIEIPYTVIELAFSSVFDEFGVEIEDDPDRLFDEFVTQLGKCVTIK